MLKNIPKTAIKTISSVITSLFNRAKAKVLGKNYKAKEIRIGVKSAFKSVDVNPHKTLGAVFDARARSEGMTPNKDLRDSVLKIAEQYFDAHKELTIAKVLQTVQNSLNDPSQEKSRKSPDDILTESLEEVMGKVSADIKTVVDTETTRAKNTSALDAISKISASLGEMDPTVYFGGPNDGHTCSECQRLYFIDGIAPRVWKMSELKHGYHKRGDLVPSVGGCHPNCRHHLVSVLPGYGFKGGSLSFIAAGYDVWADQRG